MTVGEAIATAIDSRDPAAAGKVAMFCREALGMTYASILALAQRIRPELTMAQWDDLMYEADEAASKET